MPLTDDNAAALDAFQTDLTDDATAPRSDREFVARLEQALFYVPPAATKVYVPDAEAPITPGVRDEQIAGPSVYLDQELRALSLKAKNLSLDSEALKSETANLQEGLTAKLQTLSAKTTALQLLTGSSRLGWMRSADRFLDLSQIDPSATHNVLVNTQTGSGVTISPSEEQDLTSSVQTLKLIPSSSGRGLPGNNLELSTIQGSASASSPAAGSASALATAKQDYASTGSSGLEPVVTYLGTADLHADLAAQLSDTSGSFFDLESVYVPPSQKCVLKGTAYVHDESGSTVLVPDVTRNYGWKATVTQADGSTTSSALAYLARPPKPGNTNTGLTLMEELDFGSGVPLNQIEITVRAEGGLWPRVDAVQASLDHTQWFPLTCQGSASWQNSASVSAVDTATGSDVLGTSVWDIPSYVTARAETGTPTFRYVRLSFSQSECYECPKGIGHPYYVQVVQKNDSSSALFGLSKSHKETTDVDRQPTADKLVTVSAGQATSVKSQDGAQLGKLLGNASNLLPASTLGNTLAPLQGNVGGIVSGLVTGLFGSRTHTTKVVQAGEYSDVFQGFRQCISVGRVKPLARSFPTDVSAQLVTRPKTFDHPFTALTLLVDQAIPDGTAITYEVCVDESDTWQTITPFDLGQPPAPYLSSAALMTLKLDTPATSVRLRGTLTTSSSYVAPRWNGYSLEALPA